MAIDQNIDPKELSIEELIGHFHTIKESYDLDSSTARESYESRRMNVSHARQRS
jgi:hypothetical protein